MLLPGRFLYCGSVLLTLTVVALVSPSTVLAQAVPVPPRQSLETFSFPGGTLRDYIELLKQNSPETQVIVAPQIEGLKMEAVEFKGASANAVLGMIPQLAHGRVEMKSSGWGGGGGYGGADSGNVIWRISGPPSTTRVFSVRDFINSGFFESRSAFETSPPSRDDAMKALISAIEATLEIGSNSTPDVKIKLHPDTGLLLVAGTKEQVEIVEQVVTQLSGTQKVTDNTVRDLFAQVAALENEVRQLRLELGHSGQNGPRGEKQ